MMEQIIAALPALRKRLRRPIRRDGQEGFTLV